MPSNDFELFKRHPKNPILTAKDWPYNIHAVFNPGAILMKDGKTLLLVRHEDHRGFSSLSIAISEDGVSDWKIQEKPVLAPFAGYKSNSSVILPDENERWGAEDPRITYIEEIDQYVIAYTAYSGNGPCVSLISTTNFQEYKRIGFVFPPENKDAALFPKKIDGKYLIIHRPIYHDKGHIWVSSSTDMNRWGNHKILLNARKGQWWDANKIGLGPPPIETDEGWLVLYHGVKTTVSGNIYRVGMVLLDKQNPLEVLNRSDEWLIGPKESYEREGDVDDVVFPTGWVIDNGQTTKKIRFYYGAADTSIGVFIAELDKLVSFIKKCPKPES